VLAISEEDELVRLSYQTGPGRLRDEVDQLIAHGRLDLTEFREALSTVVEAIGPDKST
jgi:hypothetical protein